MRTRKINDVLQEDEAGIQTENLSDAVEDGPEEHALSEELTEALSEGYLPLLGLFESQVAPRVWEVTVMESGWTLNGRYYPAQVVRDAAPLFEGLSVSRYGTNGHLPAQYRKNGELGPAENVLGVTAQPWVEDVGQQVRIKALFHCSDEPTNRKLEVASAAVGGGQVKNLGLSIDARGPQRPGVAEGRRGIIVEGIKTALETTMVAKPAANGRVDRLVAGLEEDEEDGMKNRKLLAFLLSRQAQKLRPVGEVATLQEEDVVARVATELQEMIGPNAILSMALNLLASNKASEAGEMLQGLLDALPKPDLTAMAAELIPLASQAAPAAAPAAVDAPAQEAVVRDLQMQVALLQSNLPETARESVRKQFTGRPFSTTELQEAIEDRRRLCAVPAARNGLVVASSPSVSVGLSKQDRLSAALDLCVGYDPAADRALQESQPELAQLYAELRRRPAMQRVKRIFQEWHDDEDCRFEIGPNSILHEALSTDFPTALNNSLNKVLLQQWDMMDPPDWQDLVYIDESIDSYNAYTNILRGGFGNIGDVPESDSADTFTMLGTPAEFSSEFQVASKGGKFILTKEMIKNDKIGIFRDIAQAMSMGAMHNLNRFVWGLITGRTSAGINQALAYDGVAIYATAHGNYSTSALSVTAMAAARQQLRLQRRFGLATTLSATNNSTSEETFSFTTTRGMFADTILLVGSELLRVKSVTDGTDAECERGYLGTTAATHSSGADVLEKIDLMPPTELAVIVPTTKETTLYTALNTAGAVGSNNNDASIIANDYQKGRLKPKVVDPHYLGGNLYAWYMAVPARYRRHTVIGFLDNKQKPEVLLQDQPTVGKVFDRRNYTYRLEFEFGGVNADYQGLQGNIATS